MKLEKTDNTTLPASTIYDDTGVHLLAVGNTDTLEHLLCCRDLLKQLVDTAAVPEHFGVLGRAKSVLDSYREPELPLGDAEELEMQDELKEEALAKALAFHKRIECSEHIVDYLMDIQCQEWHAFREVMIRLSLVKTAETSDVPAKYQELLYAVETKYPGESRHETALRYIRQAEMPKGDLVGGVKCS